MVLESNYKKYSVFFVAWVVVLLVVLLCESFFGSEGDAASPWNVPIKSEAIINEDDQGQPLKFPADVFFDWTMEETYVVAGGRIFIYGPDYFPKISLGAGRGIDSPAGIYVASDGRLFVCQGRTAEKPPRLTVLNGAFFPHLEIDISTIPGTEGFVPHRVALGRGGKIYLAGYNYRGVLVLDGEGNFLHWLKPEDNVWADLGKEDVDYKEKVMDHFSSLENGQPVEGQEEIVEEILEMTGGTASADSDGSGIILEGRGGDKFQSFGPVQITDVVSDSDGHIFLLSEETSKVYAYSSTEELLFTFGQKGGSSGKMSRPRSLAVDEKKKSFYVVDYMRHTILVYSFAGRFLFEFGGLGLAPRWFNFPTSLALNRKGHVIVADLFNQRVQVLDVQFDGGVSLFGPVAESPVQ